MSISPVNISNSPVKLDGVGLQINDSGFSVSGVEVVDWSRPWLTREFIMKLRESDDSLSFEMTNIYGQRIVINYLHMPTVPMNNDAGLDQVYSKMLRRTVSISGSVLDEGQAARFYAKYIAAQTYWAKRTLLLQRLSDSDITKTKVAALISSLTALDSGAAGSKLTLVAPLFSGDVLFAEGNSCQLSSFIAGIVTSFSFSFVNDIPVEL